MLALPREVAIGIVLVCVQFFYSQVYPLYFGNVSHIDPTDDEGAQSAGGIDLPATEAKAKQADVVQAKQTHVTSGSSDGDSATASVKQPSSSSSSAPTQAPGGESTQADEPNHFAGSLSVRHRPRDKKIAPKYRIGQGVRDKILFLKGVVVGWDATCRAPDWWRRSRLAVPEWGSKPHYLVLADMRDLAESADPTSLVPSSELNLTFYAPEATLESLKMSATFISPAMPLYFSLFDTSLDRYIPNAHIARSYPDDIDRHYRVNPDVLPNFDPKGKPLLRVVDYGRLIAHGAPVAVVRKGMFLVASENLPGEMFGQTAILLLEHNDNSGTLGVIVNKNLTAADLRLRLKTGSLMIENMQERLQQIQRQAGERVQAERMNQELKDFAHMIENGESLLKLVRVDGVELREGGPVGLEEWPVGPQQLVLHPFAKVKGATRALAGSGATGDPDLFFSRPADMKKKDIEDLVGRARKLSSEARAAGQRVMVFHGNSAWGPAQLAGEIRGSLDGASSWGWIPASSREVLTLTTGQATKEQNKAKGTSGLRFWKQLINSTALQRLENN